jgi:hypothetical protein
MLATVKVDWSEAGKDSGSEGSVFGVIDVRCTTNLLNIVARARCVEDGDLMSVHLPDAVIKTITDNNVMFNTSVNPMPRKAGESCVHSYKKWYDRKARRSWTVSVGVYPLSVPRIDPN